jgi:hypothetical protein
LLLAVGLIIEISHRFREISSIGLSSAIRFEFRKSHVWKWRQVCSCPASPISAVGRLGKVGCASIASRRFDLSIPLPKGETLYAG